VPKSISAKHDQVPFKLTPRQAKACGLGRNEIGHIYDDLVQQNYYGNLAGVNYLTQRDIDLDIIRKASVNSGSNKFPPATTPTAFSHALPVVDHIEVRRILALRRAEGAAFAVYREALLKGLNQKKLTLRQQAEFFRDVIQPEIAKIDLAVRKSKKLLVKSLAQDVVIAAGGIAIGLFSGLLPPNVGTAAVGLGGLHYSRQFVKKLTELCAEPQKAMDNRFYFLWRVKRLARKH
jgi:hypothetical protein